MTRNRPSRSTRLLHNRNWCWKVLWVFLRKSRSLEPGALMGNLRGWGVIKSAHARHILDVSIAPAVVSSKVSHQAIEITRIIMERLDVVGLLCVEFFVTHDDRLLGNERAPRPHNSGHLTFDACVTSQFEQQLRAVCGLPLGSPDIPRPAAMAN